MASDLENPPGVVISRFHEEAIARAACQVWRLENELRRAQEKLGSLIRTSPQYLHELSDVSR